MTGSGLPTIQCVCLFGSFRHVLSCEVFICLLETRGLFCLSKLCIFVREFVCLCGSFQTCVCVLCSGEINQENQELAEVDRNMKNLMLDLVKLNNLVNKNSQQHDALEQSNSLMENDFLKRLKVSLNAYAELVWSARLSMVFPLILSDTGSPAWVQCVEESC